MSRNIETVEMKEVFDRGIINVGNLVRFHRVMKKALAGEAITVGFIGGSITAGSASSTLKTCYAYLVSTWWKKKFPESQVNYINAGVGATTSKFGVARVEEDLLCLNPDVVFAEFSVNDTDTDLFQETFEGLIRRVLIHPSEPALFMFNNVFYDSGYNAQSIHNQVGQYYDLPIVSVKESIYEEIVRGKIIASYITPDNLHPNDVGHQLVAGVITNLLNRIYEMVVQNRVECLTYEIPESTITANRYMTSIRHNVKTSNPVLHGFTGDEKVKENQFDVFRYGWYGKTVGDSIRFEVEGSVISAQYRKYAIHPAPIARMVIDGDNENVFILDANFDETWGDCLYLHDIVDYGKPGKHTIEITILEEIEDKPFYLASIITVS